jgi:hypothetical protein
VPFEQIYPLFSIFTKFSLSLALFPRFLLLKFPRAMRLRARFARATRARDGAFSKICASDGTAWRDLPISSMPLDFRANPLGFGAAPLDRSATPLLIAALLPFSRKKASQRRTSLPHCSIFSLSTPKGISATANSAVLNVLRAFCAFIYIFRPFLPKTRFLSKHDRFIHVSPKNKAPLRPSASQSHEYL